jgi:hypothetical protein
MRRASLATAGLVLAACGGDKPPTARATSATPTPGVSVGRGAALERDFKLCSKPGGPGDGVGIKDNNGSTERYDIYHSNALTFNPPGSNLTCRPARF